MDLDLDFHIEFPSPTEECNNEESNIGKDEHVDEDGLKVDKIWPIPGYDDKDNSKSHEGCDKEVLVILLGWAGSKHKHLAKYSDIYLKRGCIVLRYITPLKALFVKTQTLPVLAERLVRLLKDMQLDGHPIYFHVFSNGGSFMYSYILRELKFKNIDLDLRGTVFDSCPTPRNLGKAFQAVSSIAADLGIFRYAVGSLVVIFLIVSTFWYYLKTATLMCMFGEPLKPLHLRKDTMDDFPLKNWLGRLCKMQNHNYLFLYSDNDDLIPEEQVEEIADIATSHEGNSVNKIKFKGSEHVQHYRMYPEQYIQAVTDFIRQTMKTKRPSTILWDN